LISNEQRFMLIAFTYTIKVNKRKEALI
jgi:hypothetical protein